MSDESREPRVVEVSRTFREFYPDEDERNKVHYLIAHKFLPWYVFQNPFAFFHQVNEDDCTKFIQSRCNSYVMEQADDCSWVDGGTLVFKRITDLTASWVHSIGKKAMLISMPVPEEAARAFFVLVVAFLEPQKLPKRSIAGSEVRYFTLERTMAEGGALLNLDEPAVLCEWDKTRHLNYGIFVQPTAQAFAEAVQTFLRPRRQNSITGIAAYVKRLLNFGK